VTIFVAGLLFGLGLWLSAFFSGSETGFYRMNFVRLSIDAHAGDHTATRLLWFARRPSAFVATTLVGNNVANFLTAQGVTLAVADLVITPGAGWEIGSTLAISPVVFLFGELMPKSLYFRSPQRRLLRDAPLFRLFFFLFTPISAPLILVTRLLERLGTADPDDTPLVLGRKRLVSVLEEGQKQGLLADVQTRLVSGLLSTTGAPVESSLVARQRMLGLSENASREELLTHARRYGLAEIPLHTEDHPGEWTACVRVVDLAVASSESPPLLIPLPRILPGTSRLDALLQLNAARAPLGVVADADQALGLVHRRRLTEQLFQRQATP